MTEEEANEYNRLVDEYNSLVDENNMLVQEINMAISDMGVVAGNISRVGAAVTEDVSYVSGQVSNAEISVDQLYTALKELTEQYFIFKNLSTASKNLTQYNDEYYTKFKFYNELRRITLGYVIGLDSYIISNESLRKSVEKSYLANTDYWLSYAIMSVMLWANDEKEAAQRALNKALTMDMNKSSVFYMLINLRLGRSEVARQWYINYLDKTDVNNLGDEWQHILHSYLIGAMGTNDEFENMVSDYFQRMFVQTESTNVGFSKKVQDRAELFMQNYLHSTEQEFPALKSYCAEYAEMKNLLSQIEKNSVIAKYYDDVFQKEEDKADDVFESIENILYDLINTYDEKEAVVIRNIKYNEAIIAAKGDIAAANKKYNEMYGETSQKKTFGDLFIKWAFAEDYVETDVTVKRFSISLLKDNIAKGLERYSQKCKSQIKENFNVNIDGCELICDENSEDRCADTIRNFYNKNRMKVTIKDKQICVYIFMCIGALLLLAIAALLVKTSAFSVLLVLGIVVGVVGGFLLWRRYVDIGKILQEKCRLSLLKLRDVVKEIGIWRKLVLEESERYKDLESAIGRF